MLVASTAGEIATAASGVLVALITVYGGARAANGVRSQTTPEKGQRGRARPSAAAPVAGEALGREVEGYIVRFFIFSLVASFWGAVLNVVVPLIDVQGRLLTLSISIVYTAIFLLLGLPLLVDISRKYGLRGRRLPARTVSPRSRSSQKQPSKASGSEK